MIILLIYLFVQIVLMSYLMIKPKIYKGYNLFNLYNYFYSMIMFSPRYRFVNNTLLKKYVAYLYVKQLRKE